MAVPMGSLTCGLRDRGSPRLEPRGAVERSRGQQCERREVGQQRLMNWACSSFLIDSQ